MAFTRFNYDDARIKKELQQATGSGRYILNVPEMDQHHYILTTLILEFKVGVLT